MMQNKPNREHKKDESQPSVDIKNHPAVLLAEDDAEMRRLLMQTLQAESYRVTECCDGVDLLLRVESLVMSNQPINFDVIISDIRLPGITGLEILENLHEYKHFPPMILITAFGDKEIHKRAAKSGAAAIFDKPFEIDNLLDKVRELTRRKLSLNE